MFLFEWVLHEIRKEKIKSILMIWATFFLLLLLGIYLKIIAENKKDLMEFYNTLEVKVSIRRTDHTSNLRVPYQELQVLEESGYFKSNYYKAAFTYVNHTSLQSMKSSENCIAIKLSSSSAFDEVFGSYLIGDQALSYGECIAGIGSPLNQEKKNILLQIYPNEEASKRATGVSIGLKIVDQYEGNHIFINYNQFLEVCNALSIPIMIHSADFIVKDADKISELYSYLSELELFKGSSGNTNSDYEYIVYDGTLIETTKPLKRNISILESIFPLLMLLIVCIGYVLSYITGKLEKSTLFLMHSLGTPKAFCFLSLFIKQSIYCLIGMSLGFIFLPFRYLLIYSLSYLSGITISILSTLGQTHINYHNS